MTIRDQKAAIQAELEQFGELAAFLDGFSGEPLDGILMFLDQTVGLTGSEAEIVRCAFRKSRALLAR